MMHASSLSARLKPAIVDAFKASGAVDGEPLQSLAKELADAIAGAVVDEIHENAETEGGESIL